MEIVPAFQTRDDTRKYVKNVGWQWFEGFEENDLVESLFQRADGKTTLEQLISNLYSEWLESLKPEGLTKRR